MNKNLWRILGIHTFGSTETKTENFYRNARIKWFKREKMTMGQKVVRHWSHKLA